MSNNLCLMYKYTKPSSARPAQGCRPNALQVAAERSYLLLWFEEAVHRLADRLNNLLALLCVLGVRKRQWRFKNTVCIDTSSAVEGMPHHTRCIEHDRLNTVKMPISYISHIFRNNIAKLLINFFGSDIHVGGDFNVTCAIRINGIHW